MNDDTGESVIKVAKLMPRDITIGRGQVIQYLLMHPDERPVGKSWVMQQRVPGRYSLWRKTNF